MKTGGPLSKHLFVLVALAVSVLLGLVTLAVQAAEPAKRIEIVIKDKSSKVLTGYTVTGIPTEIVVRNEDTITHGFNTSLFGPTIKVEMTGGYLAEGKKKHVYRVDAGKTMTLKFTPTQHDPDTDSFAFWCDMHRSLKGEMLVVEVTGPPGG